MNSLALRRLALQVLVFLALALGIAAWIQRPGDAVLWLIGMLVLPGAWALLVLLGAMPGPERPAARRTLLDSLLGAGLLIVGALAVATLHAMGAVTEQWTTRYGMVTTALVLLIVGNGLPKKPEDGCRPGRALAVQRLLGWTFVVTGLLLALLWLVMPWGETPAWWLTAAIYAGMFLAAGVGIVRIMRGRARPA